MEDAWREVRHGRTCQRTYTAKTADLTKCNNLIFRLKNLISLVLSINGLSSAD